MPESTTTILVVDDDKDILELIAVSIESLGYTVVKANNGNEALVKLSDAPDQINAIVSDVMMPEMDGYELCTQVRSEPQLKEIPFIFVSSKTSLEEIIKGYGVGGTDYITKPIEAFNVASKVKYIIENRIKHQELSSLLDDSRNVAMQAMTYTNSLGQVLQFMKSSAQAKSFEEISTYLFEVTSSLGLSVVMQYHSSVGIENYKQDGKTSPLEANVIEMARTKQRIFDFKMRTIFNYDDFSLLILNMPINDQEKYGLMKDILGNLCDAIEVRVKLLLSDVQVKHKDETLQAVDQALNRIDQSYRDIQQVNMSLIDEMIGHIEEVMLGFGLSEGQEDTMRGIVMYMKRKTQEVFTDGEVLYEEFDTIRASLKDGLG